MSHATRLIAYTLLFLTLTGTLTADTGKIIEVSQYLKRVTAQKGLIVRAKPDIKSRAIGLLPYSMSIWVKKEFTREVMINGIVGQWVFIDAFFDRDKNGKSVPNVKGWVFNGYLGDRVMQLPATFRNFKAGCIGEGCYVCGAIVFDPDGFFIRSIYCDGPPQTGRWKIDGDDLIACTKGMCTPNSNDLNLLRFSVIDSKMILLTEKGEVKFFTKDKLNYWESGGWFDVKGRNRNLKPPVYEN